MWSDINNQYVKQLVISNRGEYPYYLAHTCTYWGTGSTYGRPTIKVYFSKEPIIANDLYSFSLSGECVVYSINANNANQNSNEQRVNVADQRSGTIKIDNYEFIYTNAESSAVTLQPDVTVDLNVRQSHFDGVSLILIAILLGSIVAKIIKG